MAARGAVLAVLLSLQCARGNRIQEGAARSLLDASVRRARASFPVSRAFVPAAASAVASRMAGERPAAPSALGVAGNREIGAHPGLDYDAPFEDTPTAFGARSNLAGDPMLTTVVAAGFAHDDAGPWFELELPTEWAEKLVPESFACLGAERPTRHHYSGFARLAAKPLIEVAFNAMPSGAIATERHASALQLLSPSGYVPGLIETRNFPDATFLLTESVGDHTLEALLQSRFIRYAFTRRTGPVMPLAESLPIMADLLRGVIAMEEAGIVLGEFSEHAIHVMGGVGRGGGGVHAVVTDFQSARFAEGNRQSAHFADLNEAAPTGCALRDAPESEEGRPSDAANSVWQLGLIFARMMIGGGLPTQDALARWNEQADTHTAEGRQRIRGAIRQRFSIEDALGFQDMAEEHGDVLRIVSQMLQRAPASRCSAGQALGAVTRAAQERGVAIPSPRQPQALPAVAWREDVW